MMEFVEPHPPTRRRQRHQIGGESAIVGLAEISVAEDEGIGERHQLALADRLAYPKDVTVIVAKQRHLGGGRREGTGRVAAVDTLDAPEDRRSSVGLR